MPVIAQYIIESSVCLLIFGSAYQLLFRWQSWLYFERIYLLVAAILGLMIPSIHINISDLSTTLFSQIEPLNLGIAVEDFQDKQAFRVTSGDLLMVIYFLGVALLGFRKMDAFWTLLGKYQRQNRLVISESEALYFKQFFPASSFFAYTYWQQYDQDDYQIGIIKKSSFKIRPWHGWEVIIMEFLVVINWFNPIIYWYKSNFKNVHFHLVEAFAIGEKLLPEETSHHRLDRPHWLIRGLNILVTLTLITALSFLFSLNLLDKTPLQQPLKVLSNSLHQVGDYAFVEQHAPVAPIKKLVWGNQEVTLEKVAAPNGFTGSIELELEDFQNMLAGDSSIQVFSGDVLLGFEEMDIVLDIAGERGHLWFPNVKNGHIHLHHRAYGDMQEKIMRGDILSISGHADGHFLASVTFKIIDPLEVYHPKIKVPAIGKRRPKFEFQVIPRKGKKTLVRLDTNNLRVQHIIGLYPDQSRYQIVHIPNFQTDTRLVTEKSDLFSEEDDLEEAYLSVARFDRYFLPEFHASHHQKVALHWGTMTASPSSQNYHLEDFRRSYRQALSLHLDSITYHIVSFRLTVLKKDDTPKAYHLDKLGYQKMHNLFRKVKPQTSIYFDEIILQVDSNFHYFPNKFVFNIGTHKDKFELVIEEALGNLEKISRRENQLIEFQNYPMSELITILTGNERMKFENLESEPTLNVRFTSEYIDPKRGEKLILKNLKQQYYYASNLKYITKKVWIIKPPETTKKLDALEYFYHIAPNLEETIAAHKKRNLETLAPGFFDELANVIETRFDLTVFNESSLTKAYGLGLDLSSFDNLRKQLKTDYGIELEEEERVVKMVTVVY